MCFKHVLLVRYSDECETFTSSDGVLYAVFSSLLARLSLARKLVARHVSVSGSPSINATETNVPRASNI